MTPASIDDKSAFGSLTVRGYCVVLLAVFLSLTLGVALAERGAEWTCWAGGYRQNAWLAYCNSKRYGVFDVEAIWHRVEEDVQPAIESAQILTLSDSHLQNALSLGGASRWFAAHRYPVYMLGLPTEESGFGERLLERFHPHPRVVVLDASPYFTGQLGPFEQTVFEDPKASERAVLRLKEFQSRHERVCEHLPWACGHNFAYYRSRVDGHWIFPDSVDTIWIGRHDVPNDRTRFPTGEKPNESVALYPKYLAAARRLIDRLQIPANCIVITNVPADEDLGGLADYLGTTLGLTVIVPRLAGLETFDRAHLTPASAVRWTDAFLRQLEPVLRRCVPSGGLTAANLEAP